MIEKLIIIQKNKDKLKYWEKEGKKLLRKFKCTNWVFELYNSKDDFGECNWQKKVIRLSRYFIILESKNEKIMDVLLHEIAHLLDFKNRKFSKHDKEWKELAKSIGCSGKYYLDRKTYKKLANKVYKYTGICKKCGNKYYNQKLSKNSKKTSYCSFCEKGKIIWEQNF